MKKGFYKILGLILIMVVLAGMPLVVKATAEGASDNVYIGSDEVINHNIFRTGNVIVIEGAVNGDVFVAGNMVTIKGPVAGDIFVAGNNITIDSNVGGSVFVAGSVVDISGRVIGSVRAVGSNLTIRSWVARNVFMAGANVVLDKGAEVGFDLAASGANINVAGLVKRNADIFAETVTIDSQIGSDTNVEIGSEGAIALLPNARIIGDLKYKGHLENQLDLKPGAVVEGETVFNILDSLKHKKQEASWKVLAPFYAFMQMAWLFSMIIVGLVLIAAMPKPIRQISQEMMKKPGPSMGWGLIYLILTPIVAAILMFTIIGIPLAAIIMAGYFIALYLIKVVASITIGTVLINFVKKGKTPSLILALIVGVIIFVLITSIPVIGWVLKFLLVIWALGAGVEMKKKLLKQINS